MNLRDLKYVMILAETRHFGKAAERCFVSQPTLSGQIKKLESELGVTLFERTRRSVELTPIGADIVHQIRKIVERTDAITQLAQAHQDPLSGPLRAGIIPTLSPYLVPLFILPLRRRYPQLQLVLSEETTERLMQRLKDHEIDLALVATATDFSELEAMPLFDEPFWLAHPRRHPLYTKEEITRRDLEQLDLLLLAEGHCLAGQVMDVCGLKDRPYGGEMGDLKAASLETLLQLVGAGLGSTLVPALAIRGAWMTDAGIIARKLHIEGAERRVSLVYRRSFPRMQALHAFADIIRDSLPNTVRVVEPPPAK